MKTLYFEDCEIGASRETTGRTITEADVVLHAGQTGDFYPHHMDKEWCATQPFKERIAHGTLIFSVAVGMTAAEINPAAMSYGYDRLRFIKPVFHRRYDCLEDYDQRKARSQEAACMGSFPRNLRSSTSARKRFWCANTSCLVERKEAQQP